MAGQNIEDEGERRLLESYRRADAAGRRVMQREATRLANGLPPRPLAACLAEAAAYRGEAARAAPAERGNVVPLRQRAGESLA
ncbi:MAG: hypothetical protein J0H15_13680 [Xanthomonadales bacterium]|nr:hypothetical protein [Xanthomonadales bacterium]